ncbi:MAG: aminotransferase class V-fold PLP-dependent enzyme [Hyphomonadaceae bacterium]
MLQAFARSLKQGDVLENLRAGLIGEGLVIPGADGPVKLVYADYTASGRALAQVERFVQDEVLPFYANTHTETSFCGAYINQLRNAARAEIARICNADDQYAVIFTGAGATAGFNALAHVLLPETIDPAARPLIVHGPYEHHSNILPWRESGAEVVEVGEATGGGVDLAALEAALAAGQTGGRLIIGTFSAASNVTGITSDIAAVTTLLKRHGALAIWDFACGGPYLDIDMRAGGGLDAVVLSPHKFVGGPGASGVLLVRKDVVRATTPSRPGGGTVAFVSPWTHRYLDDLIAREEAGTPNVVGDIRAALAFIVKEAVGCTMIGARCAALRSRALAAWAREPRIEVLGAPGASALPIFSLRIGDGRGGHIHHLPLTCMLSDLFGIQARGGCACAGPYGHRLLDISFEQSQALNLELEQGDESKKPGWVRLNLSYLMDDAKADFVINAVLQLAQCGEQRSQDYIIDPSTGCVTRRQ